MKEEGRNTRGRDGGKEEKGEKGEKGENRLNEGKGFRSTNVNQAWSRGSNETKFFHQVVHREEGSVR